MIKISAYQGLVKRANYTFSGSDFPIRIGKDRSAAIALSGLSVGKIHCEIRCAPSGPVLLDRGSLFGTRVNDREVEEYGPLKQGDVIQVAGWRLEVGFVRNEEESDAAGSLQAPSSEIRDAVASRESRATNFPEGALESAVRTLRSALEAKRREWSGMTDEELRAECRLLAMSSLSSLPADLGEHAGAFIDRVVAEVVGLGVLESFLADPEITEIMVNGPSRVFVERKGVCFQSSESFVDEASLRMIIERIFAPLGRRIDDSCPLADGRLRDGSRVNAVLCPPAVSGSSLTIRKFSRQALSLSDLERLGALPPSVHDQLSRAVLSKKNVVVSGGTGSGKTTLLRALAQCIPSAERVVTVEDAAELFLPLSNLVALEAREANQEGEGRLTIRDLVRNALRMRPDRIIIGECRGGEALDMLQAMNTGHEGSLTSVHANSPRDAISRLEVMVMMAGFEIPLTAIREQLAASIDLIVQQIRRPDGRRLISAIDEVCGLESGVIQLQPAYRAEDSGAMWDLSARD
ncbi:MAG: FHA domain-containing protein [Betaproteobacteria bacterium]|nr:FHA domain-containing protein [Betaproteobacteria bacterium]NBT74641.1 FHA domain-containing protein [Betaproteobacteria bacterium]NBY13894.1 FHA domain-containing protein [Betaproteobacteria bacterium]